jgi:hypothetical protein
VKRAPTPASHRGDARGFVGSMQTVFATARRAASARGAWVA